MAKQFSQIFLGIVLFFFGGGGGGGGGCRVDKLPRLSPVICNTWLPFSGLENLDNTRSKLSLKCATTLENGRLC